MRLPAARPRLFTLVDSRRCNLLSTIGRAERRFLATHTMTGSLTALLRDPPSLLAAVTPRPLPDASTLTTAVAAIRLPLRQSKIEFRLPANLTVRMMSPRLLPVLRLVGQPGIVGLRPVWRPPLVLRLPSQSRLIIVPLPVLPPQALLRVRVDRWVSAVRHAVSLGDPVVVGGSEVVDSEAGLTEVSAAVGEVVLGAVAECLPTAAEVVGRASTPESRTMRMLVCLRPVLVGPSPKLLLREAVVGPPLPLVREVTAPRPPTHARSASRQTANRSPTDPRRPRPPVPAPAVVPRTPRAQVFPPPVPAPTPGPRACPSRPPSTPPSPASPNSSTAARKPTL